MEVLPAIRVLAGLRVAWGALLAFKTEPLVGAMVRDAPPSDSLMLFARTVGIRDLVFGLGALIAAFDKDTRDLTRWLAVWLASDVADVVAGAAAARRTHRAGEVAAAAAPLPFVAAGAWALRKLAAS
jgi:hypothetical protein